MEFGKNYARLIVTFRFLCYYAIPLFVIGIFYALIAKHLIYAASHVPGEIHHNAQRQVISDSYFVFSRIDCAALQHVILSRGSV
jgi:hypothetical protein